MAARKPRSKGKQLALDVALVLVVVAVLGAVAMKWLFPVFHAAMFEPKPAHVKMVTEALRQNGIKAADVKVPAINADIDMVYAYAKVDAQVVRSLGRRRSDMPGEVYSFTAKGHVLVSLSSQPARLMVGPKEGGGNGDLCVQHFRKWLQGGKLPWP